MVQQKMFSFGPSDAQSSIVLYTTIYSIWDNTIEHSNFTGILYKIPISDSCIVIIKSIFNFWPISQLSHCFQLLENVENPILINWWLQHYSRELLN